LGLRCTGPGTKLQTPLSWSMPDRRHPLPFIGSETEEGLWPMSAFT